MTPLDTLDLTLFLAVFTGLCLGAMVACWISDIYCWYHGLVDDWPGGDTDTSDDTNDANSRSVCNVIPLDKR